MNQFSNHEKKKKVVPITQEETSSPVSSGGKGTLKNKGKYY